MASRSIEQIYASPEPLYMCSTTIYGDQKANRNPYADNMNYIFYTYYSPFFTYMQILNVNLSSSLNSNLVC